MKILLTLKRHAGVKAIEHLGPNGNSVIRVGGWRRPRREVGGPIPRPDFGPGGTSAIARLCASMLIARLVGSEALVPPGMAPADVAAAFRLFSNIQADLDALDEEDVS